MFDPYESVSKIQNSGMVFATFSARLAAYIIDILLIVIFTKFAYDYIFKKAEEFTQHQTIALHEKFAATQFDVMSIYITGGGAVFILVYFALSSWLLGGSIGKKIIGLRVVNKYYKRAGFLQNFVRYAIAYFPLIIIPIFFRDAINMNFFVDAAEKVDVVQAIPLQLTLLQVAYLMMCVVSTAMIIYSGRRQALHDSIMKTFVIIERTQKFRKKQSKVKTKKVKAK